MYHYAGPPEKADDTAPAMYGQLYIMDTEAAAEQQAGLPANANCNKELLKELGSFLRLNNPYAQAYQMMGEAISEQRRAAAKQEGQRMCDVAMVFHTEGQDLRHYNVPSSNEVAAIIISDDDNDIPIPNYVAVRLNSKSLTPLSIIGGHADPMCYMLLFPGGTRGYTPSLKQKDSNKRVTMLQYYAHRLSQRIDVFNPILMAGKLFHQFLVDAYVKIESSNLDFIRRNQQKLRVDTYKGVQDYIAQQATSQSLPCGKPVILPSTFVGGPRSQREHYMDAMAICRKYGRPDIFLTYTCNPSSPDIIEACKPSPPAERPDIVARVFQLQVEELMNDLVKREVLGKVVAFTRVIEFQKRGLPHVHLLLILADDSKPRDAATIDKIVQAEIPDPELYPRLYALVTRVMIHRPCGEMVDAPCRTESKNEMQCTKRFPKQKSEESSLDESGYATYRRRMLHTATVKVRGIGDVVVTDAYCVSYNSYLPLKYQGHMNVEICSSVKCFKYLYKYIF